jgi:glucose/mannose-6-phosphate isomerase
MTDILDNANVIAQKDPEGALIVAAQQYAQTKFEAEVMNPEHDNREITSVVVTGMGGSALAALIAKVLFQTELSIPFEVSREYGLPKYVNEKTLVIASSYSGNTEETIASLEQARQKGAQVGVLASGGELIEIATANGIAYSTIPSGIQPRMAVIYNLKALLTLLAHFGVIASRWVSELSELSDWLEVETKAWTPEVATEQNYAKQLAIQAVGKTPVFYGSQLTSPLAYKWKISWNENAKNVAFWNQYPEFNHNEFLGWSSHPIEKPFAVFDLKTSFDLARVTQRMELSDKLLSGKRPQARIIQLKGETLLAQLVWGSILADFASIYTAILNGVDPTPVVLIEKLKQELSYNPV